MAKPESRSRGTRSLAQSQQLNEELWTIIGQHMTIKEWAKAAGVCPAAWGAQCMWSINIKADLPVAGWQFLLRRCSRSTALQLILTPGNAASMLKALSGAGTSPELQMHCVEDLRVTAPHISCSYSSAVAKRAAVHDAFSALALACKNIQVAVLTCQELLPLPPFAALKHLILSTSSPADLPITWVKHATSLETLSLGVCGPQFGWSMRESDYIFLSSLHALKHVRINDFMPRWLDVPDGCLLHLVWDGEGVHDSEFEAWACDMQLLWEGQSIRLGSMQICFKDDTWHTNNMAALRTMLTERVRFRAGKVCRISVIDMQPKWKDLSIVAAKVNLEAEDTAALVRSLDNLQIDGIANYGSTILSMVRELDRSGRMCFVRRQTIDLDTGPSQGFSFGSFLDCAAQRRFKALMCCGCSSCLPCLSQAGKLSRDSVQPIDFWRHGEPAYSLKQECKVCSEAALQ